MTKRTVLTTGANSGLGLATVIEMARRGHRSVGTVRSKQKGKTVRNAAKAAGVSVETRLMDVTDADACQQVVEAVQPDILVNNAGYMLYSAVEEVGDDEARALLDTMVIAPMRLARLCLPGMRERGGGRIIQISSLSARASFPLMGWYQASKQALEGVSDALRLEVAGDGIAVILIEPGVFRSELSEDFTARQGADDSRYVEAYEASRTMFARMERFLTDAEAVARVVAKAAETRNPQARYLAGFDAHVTTLTGPFIPEALRDLMLRRTSGL